jgi:hypothetical protein
MPITDEDPRSDRPAQLLLRLTRVWLPIGLGVAGFVLILIGHGTSSSAGAGVVVMGSGLMVWMLNWAFRLSVESNRDREQEEAARDYFERHGHWPDEQG